MKIRTAILVALFLNFAAWLAVAQPGGGGPPDMGGGPPGGFGGGPGGGGGGGFGGGGPGGGGGFGGGRGNFDPAQMQQMMLDNMRDQLEVTNDDEWNVIKPLIQKVNDARQATQAFGGGGRGGFGRGGFGGPGGGGPGGGGPGGGGQFGNRGGTPNPVVTALQNAIASGSIDQIKTATAKFRDARKAAQDKLAAVQDALKAVLTAKQEAVGLQMGLVN